MKTSIAIGLLHLAMVSASWSVTPAEILENVEAKYLSLDSIAFDSTIVSEDDHADVRTKGKKDASPTTCKGRLARPGFYRVEWTRAVTKSYIAEGAAWSSGVRHNTLLSGKVSQHDNIDLAFAGVMGAGGGYNFTKLFFQRPGSVLQTIENPTLQPDEKLGGLDCYVVSGESPSGVGMTLWITKEFLVIQVRQSFGGNKEASEKDKEVREKAAAAVHKFLEQNGKFYTAAEAAQSKESREKANRESMLRRKWSTTETIESMELNPSFEKELFEGEGLKLPSLPR
jgi:hypothetical protein